MRKRRGTAIGELLVELGARLDRKSGGALAQSKAAAAWERVAGPKVLEHTTGAHLREGEFIVYVDSPAWATELSALSEKYREAVEQDLGEGIARGVRFCVSNRVSRARGRAREEAEIEAYYEADPTPAIALSEGERAQVEASAASIPDEALREAAIRATVADLEWKKGIAAAKRRQGPREGV